ncbi:MAG: hypothetical protein AB1899_16260 [Pseudomonadota bacterium]
MKWGKKFESNPFDSRFDSRPRLGRVRPGLVTGILVQGLLTGCASDYNPADYYDPAAVKLSGRIEAKAVSRVEERGWADAMEPHHRGLPLPIPVGNQQFLVLFIGGASRGKSEIPIHEYRIVTDKGEKLLVYSEFPGHAVGDCVQVFLSSRPDYPRMANGGTCAGTPAPAR